MNLRYYVDYREQLYFQILLIFFERVMEYILKALSRVMTTTPYAHKNMIIHLFPKHLETNVQNKIKWGRWSLKSSLEATSMEFDVNDPAYEPPTDQFYHSKIDK